MKILSLALLLFSLSSVSTMADDEHKHEKGQKHNSVEGMIKESKSSRRKKVEMCHDCGKPEVNCDCPEELKKKEKEAQKQ